MGDGTGNTKAGTASAPAGRLQVPIYARIPPRQAVAQGRYGDSVVVTLEW